MTLSRRALLKLGLSSVSAATLCDLAAARGIDLRSAAETREALYISGARRGPDEYVAAIIDGNARIVASIPLPARAHGAASHFSGQACIFARRPGLFMSTFNVRNSHDHNIVKAVSGRHFYGHGAYSADGRYLYATENDYDSARGVVGVYDVHSGHTRIAEFASGGIGPHEVLRVPGSDILIVANGGIQTHPDSGREKLNLNTMRPSLCLLDSRTGKLLGRYQQSDALHQVSLRHLACAEDGIAWIAGQYNGEKMGVASLAGRLDIAKALKSFNGIESSSGFSWISIPQDLLEKSQYYLSSVALVGGQAIFTSSRGGLAFSVDRQNGRFVERYRLLDCSGVASAAYDGGAGLDSYAALLSSGSGELAYLSDEDIVTAATHTMQWDNHIYRIQ